jgi:hypothetical protein
MNEAKVDVKLTPEEVQYLAEKEKGTRFDNEGREVVENRKTRRTKPTTDPKYTKATHSLKLAAAKSKKAYRKNH